MRVLCTFAGGAGHLNPLLPVATAARGAGHAVALAGKASVVAAVDGFEVFGTGAENDAAQTARRPLEPIDRDHEERVLRDSFAGTIAQRRTAELLDVAASWRPDVFVCDETDFGGTTAAERLGLPHATMLVTASGSFVRPDLLDGVFDVGLLSRYLVFNPFPPSFRDPRFPLPATAHGIRLHHAAPAGERGERPHVYFSLGTIFDLESGDLFERVVRALGSLDVDAVATIGRRVEPPAALGEPPPNVRVERYIPQAELLPSCDLVVSHGGSGSILGALSYGLPVVVLPLGADQPWNADRCEATGVGRVVDAGSTTATIAEAVSDVLADSAYREASLRLKAELEMFAPPEASVELLEQL